MLQAIGNIAIQAPVIVCGVRPHLWQFHNRWYCEAPGLLIGRGWTLRDAYRQYLELNSLTKGVKYVS